jgi:chaperonin GroEL
VLAVKAPGYGDRKKELLADIAVTVGAKVISEETGLKLETVDLTMLGKARKVIATKDKTVIVDGKGKKAEIEHHVAALKKQKESTESKFDVEKIDERIAKLTGGVAVIKVGAATETEMKYLKLKIEDAVNATKAAIAEGIVAGGGSALIRAGKKAEERKAFHDAKAATNNQSGQAEIAVGYSIVLRALEAPLRQIATNSGKDNGAVIAEKVKMARAENAGYNAVDDTIIDDMLKAGIIDPVKVTRTALENAVSIAGLLATAGGAIIYKKD